MGRATPAADGGPIEPWSRARLLTVTAGVLSLALLLAGGLGLSVHRMVRGDDLSAAAAAAGPSPVRAGLSRDEIAAAAMSSVAPDQGRPGARMSTARPAIFEVPPASSTGAAGVASGFPQSPAGAVAQLGAVVTAVLDRMDVEHAAQVYAAWSVPDAPAVESWPLMAAVRSFLEAARLSRLEPGQVVVTTPVGAMVKGTDGPTWTLACVLVTVRARVKAEARIAYGHCERMTWLAGRWVIGAGLAPARAPGTWPGSEAMVAAGWRSWEEHAPR